MSNTNEFLRRLNSALPKEQRHAYESPEPVQPMQPKPGATPTVDDLLNLGKNAYSSTIQQHISIEHEAMWALFLDPQLVTRTYQALRRIYANLLRVAEKGKFADGESSAVRRRRRSFYEMVTERLQEVEALLPDDYFLPGREAYESLRLLTAAVHKHRASVVEADVIPEEWDTQLWKAADHAGRSLRQSQNSAEGGRDDD